jgi:Zn finger protein HypA/HybF involved in hydrogenase expression
MYETKKQRIELLATLTKELTSAYGWILFKRNKHLIRCSHCRLFSLSTKKQKTNSICPACAVSLYGWDYLIKRLKPEEENRLLTLDN